MRLMQSAQIVVCNLVAKKGVVRHLSPVGLASFACQSPRACMVSDLVQVVNTRLPRSFPRASAGAHVAIETCGDGGDGGAGLAQFCGH